MNDFNKFGQGVLNQAEYTSATVVSAAANFIMNRDEAYTHTFRTYIRLRENGRLSLKFWHGNAVDSTWDMGQEAAAGEPGGEWSIEAAYVADGGLVADGTVAVGSAVAVTYAGNSHRQVAPGETFWSDEVQLELPEGHYLAFSWTLKSDSPGKSVPYNVEGMLVPAYDAPGNLAVQETAESYTESDKLLVMPAYIGYKKKVKKKLVFLGDSITQGVRTEKDEYTYWAARIAKELGTGYGLWNIGSGWGRAYDVAAGGAWLNKAQQGDEVLIVLGVNDLDIGQRSVEELLKDLAVIISLIKEANPEAEIILSTVPPFNFEGGRELAWRHVNGEIRSNPPEGTARVFDIAAVLSMPAPHEHLVRAEYMSNSDDPHPNGLAGQAVAEAFMKWYSAGNNL
ncbi:SGNH/GDSL hydrolase family protein [Paenibacillus sp. sgz500958]|uniref:SGNH/GDSL hydrolase family protein n=1 Tax=Paenibacillus sp. sgz500958 TaxID=3242475 RepID=UPI0036D36482